MSSIFHKKRLEGNLNYYEITDVNVNADIVDDVHVLGGRIVNYVLLSMQTFRAFSEYPNMLCK